MLITDRIRLNKKFNDLLIEENVQFCKIQKCLTPTRNAFWIFYEPSLQSFYDEIQLPTISASLKECYAEIIAYKQLVEKINSLYATNSKILIKHQNEVKAIKAKFKNINKDINNLIANFSSLDQNYPEIKNAITTYLSDLQKKINVLLYASSKVNAI